MEEFMHLLQDPAHWGFEIVADTTFTVVAAILVQPLAKRFWARHHDKYHGGKWHASEENA